MPDDTSRCPRCPRPDLAPAERALIAAGDALVCLLARVAECPGTSDALVLDALEATTNHATAVTAFRAHVAQREKP